MKQGIIGVLKPIGGRQGLPGNAKENAATTTVAANGGLWTWGFKSKFVHIYLQNCLQVECSSIHVIPERTAKPQTYT